MNWEAFATPPAPPSKTFRSLCKHLYSTKDRRAHDAETVLLNIADIVYFGAVGYRHNPLDRKVTA